MSQARGSAQITTRRFHFTKRQSAASGSQTPVDLHHYASHVKEKADAPAMELGRLLIARRPALDLAAATPTPPVKPQGDPGDIDLDAPSAFDVPAFLRREG